MFTVMWKAEWHTHDRMRTVQVNMFYASVLHVGRVSLCAFTVREAIEHRNERPSDRHLHSEVGDDRPLVSLQRLQGDMSDFGLRLSHEHLAGCSQHLFILTLDLHL